jgi:hypothetical protein
MAKRKYTGIVLTDCAEQTRRWVAGESLHSDHRGLGPECCPDFSCCVPELLQPVEVRRAFQAADSRTQNKLCMLFLGGMMAKARPDVRAHITDGFPEEPC